MLVSQARSSLSGSAGWFIAWAGLPPGSGQSGLTAGGGRVTGVAASFGIRLDLAADPEHRDPLARQRLLLVLEPVARGRTKRQQQRGKVASVHRQTRPGYDLRAAAISAARARRPCGADRSSASSL